MKKYLLLLSICFSFFLSSCYEDYMTDYYVYDAVYFPKTELARTAISDEGLSIKVGVFHGGDLAMKRNVKVKFVIDNTLLGTKYIPLPEDYYTLSSPDEIIIPKGQSVGYLDVNFDAEKFKGDDVLLSNKANDKRYALAFRIVEAEADSILEKQKTIVIPIKYQNTFEGCYYMVSKLTYSAYPDSVRTIGDAYDYVNAPAIENGITTTGFNSCKVQGIADQLSDKYFFYMNIDNSNNLTISPADASIYKVSGSGKWDPVKRYFYFNYSFDDNKGNTVNVEETRIFRNRNRDGKIEWRWEGFPGN